MEARWMRLAICASCFTSLGATYSTPNFVVHAESPKTAKAVAAVAEHWRDKLAEDWLGKKLPRWYRPCQVTVKVGPIGAGGATTFAFDRGHVFGWKMNVQGSLERILDSVVPHEVSHTIFACHFRRPLPRWADEGAATLVEHESEQRRQRLLLKQVMNTRRRIPLKQLLSIKEYPRDMQNVLTLYAEGYSLADFLVQKGGKVRYLKFLEHAHLHGWDRAIQQHYKIHGVAKLEAEWTGWIADGSQRLNLPKGQMLAAAASRTKSSNSPDKIIRSQSPDAPETKPAAREAGPTRNGRNRLQFPVFRQPVVRSGSRGRLSRNEAVLPRPQRQTRSRPSKRPIDERKAALPIPFQRNR